MAVYRESAPLWRRRLPLIIAITVILTVIIAAVLIAQPRGSSTDNKTATLQTLATLSQSLDLFDIEYAKIVKGTPAAQTGAPGAIRKAIDALNGASGTLQPLNPTAFNRLQILLNDLNNAVSANPSPNVSDKMSDANAQLVTLRTALSR